MEEKTLLEIRIDTLMAEYNQVITKMTEHKNGFEQLNIRKIEIEGAVRELQSMVIDQHQAEEALPFK